VRERNSEVGFFGLALKRLNKPALGAFPIKDCAIGDFIHNIGSKERKRIHKGLQGLQKELLRMAERPRCG
jgi:hypothetical protein